jgi:hypothetical protein
MGEGLPTEPTGDQSQISLSPAAIDRPEPVKG